MRATLLLFLLACLPFTGTAQFSIDSLEKVLETQPPDTNRMKTLSLTGGMHLDQGHYDVGRDYFTKSLELAGELGARKGEAKAYRNIGISYYQQGRSAEALAAWEKSLAIYAEMKDSAQFPPMRMNIANAYTAMGDHDRAQKTYYDVLAWAERTGDAGNAVNCLINLSMVSGLQGRNEEAIGLLERVMKEYGAVLPPQNTAQVLANMGQLQVNMKRTADAKKTFMEMKRIAEEAQMENMLAHAEKGLGDVALLEGDRSSAREHFLKALRIHRGLGDVHSVAINQERTGAVSREAAQANDHAFLDRYHKGSSAAALAEARARMDSAVTSYKEIGDVNQLPSIYQSLSAVEQAQGDYRGALEHHQLFKAYSDTLLNSERDKKLTESAMTYAFEKKEAAALAEQEKKDQRQRLVRNGIAGGLAFALLFLGVVWRQRNRISKEKARSEELLLNILPEEVAEELKDTGAAAAKHFDSATILFSDFKGFTQASEKMSPQELVEELNTCFKAFDNIITARGIEKIKTIGDAYMCAGGLPDPKSSSPAAVVKAALEMQAFMKARKAERDALNKPAFEMRVGIHTGPVVAGIVGVKKFQYDIWGDTVNTASRMESSGEVGRVNISEATYALVTASESLAVTPSFTFTRRGKVPAKGKGEMEMYFVSSIN